MNKIFIIIVSILVTIVLSGCTLGVDEGENSVTIYSERHYDTDQILFDQFESETGIKVNVVKAKADELIAKLELEGEDTLADLLLIADAGRLHIAKEKDLLQSVESDIIEENIPSKYQDDENFWFGLTVRARVLVYHPDRVDAADLSTYEALTDSVWNDRIVVRSGTNIYNQSLVASFITINGIETTRQFISGLVNNFARDPEGNDRDQAKAVMAGIADIAIMNTYYMGKMFNSEDEYEREVANKLEVFFPNQETTGTHINVSAAGVTKHAKNVENAIKLIEFLSSESAQATFAEANYEFPVNQNVELTGLLETWGTFISQDISLTSLGIYSSQAAILMDEEGWK